MAESHLVLAQAAPPASHASTAVAASGGSSDFPPFDTQFWAPQIIWLAIIFGVLYLTMSRIALPRVGGILQDRRKRLESDVGAAEAARNQAEAEGAAYERLLADARARAQAQGQETHARLAAESELRRKNLETDLNEKLAAADRQIAETKGKAMANVASIASETTAAIVSHLLGRAADPDAVAHAVSETLKD